MVDALELLRRIEENQRQGSRHFILIITTWNVPTLLLIYCVTYFHDGNTDRVHLQ